MAEQSEELEEKARVRKELLEKVQNIDPETLTELSFTTETTTARGFRRRFRDFDQIM
jgi:hypothetical protein